MKPDRELFRDEHKGINVEVSSHWREDWTKEVWCFYLYLCKEMFPIAFHEDLEQPVKVSEFGSILQPYAKCLENLDWHCGMTYYEVSRVTSSPFVLIKAGCDYDHIWDDGHYYSAESVMSDAKRCVDSLLDQFKNIKTSRELWAEYRIPFEAARKKTS